MPPQQALGVTCSEEGVADGQSRPEASRKRGAAPPRSTLTDPISLKRWFGGNTSKKGGPPTQG